ncbi:response regulator [Mesorhizobium sp. YC-39]|uniref:response regulator n=1 Tax=unclassified Mesorhizobium TaxID=325217 RepID=UPI0021E89E77|nr:MULTISPECIES: response regulator [unclassified Mesorhizobium]MCV3211894.1 response regulator [Mesorhizobium sp. YC-2]MCV3233617.1 response regulator [Mesorhizobium sp. YC-39]
MGSSKLRNCSILIAEDDYTLASDLRDAFVKVGASVIHPSYTIEDTLDVIMSSSPIDGAILSVNLQGEATFVAAEHLLRRQIPFLFLESLNSSDIPPSCRTVDRFKKSIDVSLLTEALGAMISA